MLAKTTVVAALATAATAQMAAYPAHLAGKRSLENDGFDIDATKVPDLSEATACVGAFLDLYKTMPTPPPELIEELAKQTAIPDVCSYTPPASIASDYSSYESVFRSWYTSNEAQFSSALSKCPEYATSIDKLTVCTQTAGGSGGSSDSKTTAAPGTGPTGSSSSGSNSGPGSGSSISTAGAARETGFVGAAVVAAAGFLGAVAAL